MTLATGSVHRGLFVRLFSSAILMQAVLSGASLCVGLLLIRHTTDVEYGYYVLITNTVLLMSALQLAYIQPSLVHCLTNPNSDREARGAFVGGLYREQRTLLLWLTAFIFATALLLWQFHVVSGHLFAVMMAGAVAALFTLFREFFRNVLLAYRRPNDALRGDTLYAACLVIGAVFAIQFSTPAAIMALALALAAFVGGWLQRWSLQRHEPWDINGHPGVLRHIYSVGSWATLGAGIHWAFAQGYNYLIAGTLSVTSVAAIAATRTLIMPVNLVSTGISAFMFPTVSAWLQHHRPAVVLKRMSLLAAALVVGASFYLAFLWLFRDWIFVNVLRKSFPQQDLLLILWFAVAIAMLLRDQMLYVLVARARFRMLSVVTLISAVLSLSTSYIAMRSMGNPGALYGLLFGEITSVIGLTALSLREASLPNPDR